MITQETRQMSFEYIKPKRFSRYTEILEIIGDKKMTAREIEMERINQKYSKSFDMNHVRPRLTELVNEYHELIECDTKEDFETNRKVAVYRKTTAQEKMEVDKEYSLEELGL